MPDGITLADVNAGLAPALALLSALDNPKAKAAALQDLAAELAKVTKERQAFSGEIKEYRAFKRREAQFAKDEEKLKADQEALTKGQDKLRADRGAFATEVKTTRDELDESIKAVAAREDACGKLERSLKRRDTQVGKRETAVGNRLKQLADAGIKVPDLPDAA